MSAARGIRAGKAYVEIYGDNNPLSRALKQSGKMLQAWGSKMRAIGLGIAAAGTAALGTMLAAARSFAKTGDEIAKMSKRIGASTEFVSALGYAAAEGGTDLGQMETGVRRLQRAAYDAANGSKSAADAFATLGVNTRDANGNLKTTEDLFRDTAGALAKVQNNTTKAALAQTLFGRAGTALLPMLHEGAEGLDAAMQRAQELGLVWNGTDAAAAEELTDAMMRIKAVAGRLWTTIGAALAPALTSLADGLARLLVPAGEWLRQNAHIIQLAAGGAAAAVAAGGALIGLGVAFTIAGKLAVGLAAAIGVVKVAVLALLSPVGLAVAGVTALAAYALHSTGALGSAFGWIRESLNGLSEFFTATLGGMKDALAAGDWKLAAEVLWKSLKLAWAEGTAYLLRHWTDFKFGAARIFSELWTGIRVIWAEATAAILHAWNNVTTGIMSAWDKASTTIAKGIGWIIAKVEGLDPAQVQSIIEEDHQRRERGRRDTSAARRREIDAQARAAVEALGEEHVGAMKALDAEQARQLKGVRADADQARKEWEEALATARQARLAAESGAPGPGAFEAPAFDPIEFGKRSASIQGTFSAAAAQAMGRGPQDRMLEIAQEQAADIRTIRNFIRGVQMAE